LERVLSETRLLWSEYIQYFTLCYCLLYSSTVLPLKMSLSSPNLWQSLLGSAMRSEREADATLLVLGDAGAGKRALVRRLRGCVPRGLLQETEEARGGRAQGDRSNTANTANTANTDSERRPRSNGGGGGGGGGGGVVRYTFFPAVHPADKDADVDTAPTCNVWELAERRHGSFLDCALLRDGGGGGGGGGALLHTAVVIVLDFQRPAGMIASLEGWLATVEKEVGCHVQRHAERDRMVQSLRDHVRLYRAKMRSVSSSSSSSSVAVPAEGEDSKSITPDETAAAASTAAAAAAGDNAANLDDIELPEGVLTTNLGVPVIVCCNKTDLIGASNMRRQSGSPSQKSSKLLPEDCADYVQQHLRDICIKYGAALFFTSSKEGDNIEELHQYLLHRMYPSSDAFRFAHRAEVVDSTNILIPSGFDMPQLIADMKGDILEGSVDAVLGGYGLPPVANPPPAPPPPASSSSPSSSSTVSATPDDDGAGTKDGEDDGVSESSTKSESSSITNAKKVTAYSEQEFLERLLKRQLAEDRVLGTRSAVGDMKLRDEVRSMDTPSSNPKAPSSRGSRADLKMVSSSRRGSGGGGEAGDGKSTASSSSSSRRTRNSEKAEGSTSRMGGASGGSGAAAAISSSSSGTRRTSTKTGGSSSGGTGSGSGGGGAGGGGGVSSGGGVGGKDNPKLIKNFFQSLLKPRAGAGDKSGDKSTSSGAAAPRRSSRARKAAK
jgi:hypothetical protein